MGGIALSIIIQMHSSSLKRSVPKETHLTASQRVMLNTTNGQTFQRPGSTVLFVETPTGLPFVGPFVGEMGKPTY